MNPNSGQSGQHPTVTVTGTGTFPAMSSRSAKRKAGMRPWLGRALLENFWLKLISLVVALGFYGFLNSTSDTQRALEVPIFYNSPPPEVRRELVTQIPQSISVKVEGPQHRIDNLESKLDPIILNLRDARDDLVRFTPEMISGLPPGVRVKEVVPESLQIRWENVIDVPLDVQVPITGQLGKGLELKDAVLVDPARITASGPESAVKSVQLARAEPFDIGGLGEGRHSRSLALTAAPARVTFSQITVEATVEIARKMVSREFDVRVQVVGLARAKTEPATVRVYVEGSPERTDALRPDGILARVEAKDVNAAQPGNAMMPVIVDIPDAKVRIEPAQVLVRW